MLRSLVGSEMCIRDRYQRRVRGKGRSSHMRAARTATTAAGKRTVASSAPKSKAKKARRAEPEEVGTCDVAAQKKPTLTSIRRAAETKGHPLSWYLSLIHI
eukprot:TRINITY_DN20526_c0_g1_i1.p2 TRINITY_DN20526_c0_g1~~TRINITY_DN20526_c0_g1_i1.p2  ORF type:complete len:101 (+),score=29.90 TRINITY_DN20526_c0_g1_i1:139-441(+)